MEFVMEIVFELYLELMMLVIPEEYAASKKVRAVASVAAVIMLIAVIAAFIGGLSLISKGAVFGGTALIAGSVIVSIGQIIAGFFVASRKSGSIIKKLD